MNIPPLLRLGARLCTKASMSFELLKFQMTDQSLADGGLSRREAPENLDELRSREYNIKSSRYIRRQLHFKRR
eukprot:6176414-Pleurochrysis_carterae.AAC.1